MIGGYHAAKLTRYQDLIDRHLSHFTQGAETDADWNVLNMLNARYVVGMDGQPLLNPEAYGNAWFIDKVEYVDGADAEMAVLGKIDTRSVAVADSRFRSALGSGNPATPGDTIFETSYNPAHLTYHANSAKGGVAVFSEVFFPWGWTATIDGKPAEIDRVNYLLRAINIPAGSHTIEMTFNPESLRVTDRAATGAIILIYIGLIAAVAETIRRLLK